jgi:hypothetical protein
MSQKVDIFSVPRRERKSETRSWSLGEGLPPFELTLRKLNAADGAAMMERAQILIEDYITGSDAREAGPFPDPEVKLSRQFFQNVCTVCEMQVAPVYAPIELAILFDRQPEIGEQVLLWVNELNREREAPPEGPPAAPSSA